jgi:hypothetical protein
MTTFLICGDQNAEKFQAFSLWAVVVRVEHLLNLFDGPCVVHGGS